jgi:hypothetical protein
MTSKILDAILLIIKDYFLAMYEDRDGQEYHITLLGVRMRVKFPCKMKLEHQGSLITA